MMINETFDSVYILAHSILAFSWSFCKYGCSEMFHMIDYNFW